MDKELGKDLTVGSIPRHLLVFSIRQGTGTKVRGRPSIFQYLFSACWKSSSDNADRSFCAPLHTLRVIRLSDLSR